MKETLLRDNWGVWLVLITCVALLVYETYKIYKKNK